MKSSAVRRLVLALSTFSFVFAVGGAADAQPSHRILHAFTGNFPAQTSDGSAPQGGLVLGIDGFLYGRTDTGGASCGTLFRVRPDGSRYDTLHRFDSCDGPYSASPDPLVQDADGYLYGVRNDVGGTLFRLDVSSGTPVVTTLHAFSVAGHYPHEGVQLASDGRLYGTLVDNGNGVSSGAVFSIARDGSGFQVVHTFSGEAPVSGVIEGLDGRLYGATDSFSGGHLFGVDKDGANYAELHSGLGQVSTLAQGPDGTLYGAAFLAGSHLAGSVFRIQPDGSAYQALHDFDQADPGGYAPSCRLALSPDGSLYGTASQSPSWPSVTGSVFRLTTDGSTFEDLHVFTLGDGAFPSGGLALLPDGVYGVTVQGGSTADVNIPFWGQGAIFALGISEPLQTELVADPFVPAGGIGTFTLKLRNVSAFQLAGPLTVVLRSSSGLQYLGESSDGWSSAGPGDARQYTWAGTLGAGAETDLHVIAFDVAAVGPFAQYCAQGPRPCVSVQAARLGNGAAPVVARAGVVTENPTTGQPNAFPIAVDDTADVYDNLGVTVFALANDYDPDGDALKIVEIVEAPTAGDATIDADGTSFSYSPYAALTGNDTLLYRVEDSAGASVVARVTLVPRPVNLTLSKSRIDLGVIPVGRLAAGRAALRGGPTGLSGAIRFEAVAPSEFAAILAGTGHDPTAAVSDPQAFTSIGWSISAVDDFGPVGVPMIWFRPSSNVGQVSITRAVLETTLSTGTVSTSVYVIGASGDPATTLDRALDDSASTPVNTPVTIPVLDNDTDLSGRGKYISQYWGCPNLEEHLFTGAVCGDIHGTYGGVNQPALNAALRYTPAAGYSGESSTYYGMSEIDACANPLQPGCVYEGNMYFARVTVTVGATPSHALTIAPAPAGGSVSGGGLACGNGGATCQVSVDSGTSVALTATPASGYVFTSWGGSCSGTSPSTSVLVDAAKTCSATFTATGGPVNGPPYTMTITLPTGGKVVGAGLNCGAGATQCSVTMPAAMTLGIGAVPSAGYTFSGWTGDCSGTNPGLWVALNGPRTCGATFTSPGGGGSVSLTIAPAPTGGSVSGSGLVCGNGGAVCQVTFGSATTATLTATPASGYVFMGWGGACAGTNTTTQVLVDAAKTCSATFTSSGGGPVNGPPYTMTITPPTGGVIQGAGLNCGAGAGQCSVTMPAPMTLGIGAAPSAGYVFGGWTGDCSGSNPSLWVSLNGPRTCGAIFTPTGGGGSFSLTISPAPTGGSVSGNGLACGNGGATCQVTFGSATTAALTATAASGYAFTGWGGSCTGTNPSTTVLVDAARTCSATFTSTGGGPVNGPPYTMTITPPTGGAIQGAGLNCGLGATQCSVTMPSTMILGLGATSAPGYLFGGWTGDCSGTDPSLWVTLNGPRTCGAVFTPK